MTKQSSKTLRTFTNPYTFGKDVFEGDVKRSDDGPPVVGGTQPGNVKRSDDGPSVVGSTHRDMSYAEVVSKR